MTIAIRQRRGRFASVRAADGSTYMRATVVSTSVRKANAMDDNIIPVLGIICLFGLPMVGWNLGRVMKHRERMELLRLGIAPPPDGRGWNRNRGAAWTQQQQPPPWAPGPGAPVGPNYAAYEDPNSAQCTLRRGIT